MVAAAASSATKLARELDGLRLDVVVVDYDLAGDDGLSHCRRIKSRPQPPAVIIYSAYAGSALTLRLAPHRPTVWWTRRGRRRRCSQRSVVSRTARS